METDNTASTPDATDSPTPAPTLEPPTAADVRLDCTPGAISATTDAPTTVTCTVAGADTLGDRQLTLTQVSVSPPDGWTVAGNGTSADGALTVSPNAPIAAGQRERVTFELAPDSCDAPAGSASVATTLAHPDVGSIQGPSAAVAAEVARSPAAPPNVDVGPLLFGSTALSESGYSALTASATVTVSAPETGGCADTSGAWVVQVSTDGLYQRETGEHIPADAMVYLGTSSSGAPSGVSPVNTDVPLASGPVTIVHLRDVSGSGGTWTVEFALAPPPGISPGTYGGSITFTVVNAP